MYFGRTDDPYLDADRWLDELEHQYDHRPVCSECGEHIQEEYAYQIDDKLICIPCMNDHREWMDKYDG